MVGRVGCLCEGCRAEEERVRQLTQRYIREVGAKQDVRPSSRSQWGLSKDGLLIDRLKCRRNRPFFNDHYLPKARDESNV